MTRSTPHNVRAQGGLRRCRQQGAGTQAQISAPPRAGSALAPQATCWRHRHYIVDTSQWTSKCRLHRALEPTHTGGMKGGEDGCTEGLCKQERRQKGEVCVLFTGLLHQTTPELVRGQTGAGITQHRP